MLLFSFGILCLSVRGRRCLYKYCNCDAFRVRFFFHYRYRSWSFENYLSFQSDIVVLIRSESVIHVMLCSTFLAFFFSCYRLLLFVFFFFWTLWYWCYCKLIKFFFFCIWRKLWKENLRFGIVFSYRCLHIKLEKNSEKCSVVWEEKLKKKLSLYCCR